MNAPVINNILSLLAPGGVQASGAAGGFSPQNGQTNGQAQAPLFTALLAQAIHKPEVPAPALPNAAGQLKNSTLLSPVNHGQAADSEEDTPSTYDLLGALLQQPSQPQPLASETSPQPTAVLESTNKSNGAQQPVAQTAEAAPQPILAPTQDKTDASASAAPNTPAAPAPQTVKPETAANITPSAQKLMDMIDAPFATQAKDTAVKVTAQNTPAAVSQAEPAKNNFGPSAPLQAVSGTTAFLTQMATQQGKQAAPPSLPIEEGEANIPATNTTVAASPTDLQAAIKPTAHSAAKKPAAEAASLAQQPAFSSSDISLAVEADGLEIQMQQSAAPKAESSVVKFEVPTPAPNLQDANAIQQMSTQLNSALKVGAHKITVALSPQELGNVEIAVEFNEDNSQAKVHITADKADTLNALHRDSKELIRGLNQAGLQTDSRDISFHLNRDDNHHAANSNGQQHEHQQDQKQMDQHSAAGSAMDMPEDAISTNATTALASTSLATGAVNMMI